MGHRRKQDDPATDLQRGTETSAFGSPGRASHDSSTFYSSRLYEGQQPPAVEQFEEQALPRELANRILLKSSQDMSDLPDHCIHLMVTSPPYNASKEYDEDLTLEEYGRLLRSVFKETFRVLVTGGRACVNIANLGRKPYLPLHALVITEMLELGFLMRGEIIWDKAASASASTAWGSWLSAANPVLRDVHEYILVFSKGSFRRPSESRESTITRDEFLDWTKSVWTFPAVSARQIGHPAPFPQELPRRLIQLYTFKGDVVLDPFAGSGTTCLAARDLDRVYVGYEINPEYHELAQQRLKDPPA
jgi:site-specific DNA-methyltransferase (adenine-specific)